MALTIKNAEEVGYKYFDKVGKKCYVYNHAWKPVEVEVSYTMLVQNRIEYPGRTIPGVGHGIAGAILGGLAGYLLVAGTQKTKWDADFDIFLSDGSVLEVTANTEGYIRILNSWHIKVDPHAKGRARRQKMKGEK